MTRQTTTTFTRHRVVEMKIKDLKQRQKVKNRNTGEVLRVSKQDYGKSIYLVNPETGKKVIVLGRTQTELTEWVVA